MFYLPCPSFDKKKLSQTLKIGKLPSAVQIFSFPLNHRNRSAFLLGSSCLELITHLSFPVMFPQRLKLNGICMCRDGTHLLLNAYFLSIWENASYTENALNSEKNGN